MMGRKNAILIGLALVWAFIVVYNTGLFRKVEEPVKRIPAREAAFREGVPKVRLDLLNKKPPAYKGIRKDIFSPLYSPPPPAPAPKAASALPEPPPAPILPTPIESFMGEVKFLGFLEKGKAKTVFLERKSDVFLVKSGDLIDKRFLVSRITDTQLVIKDVLREEEATLRIVEKEEAPKGQ